MHHEDETCYQKFSEDTDAISKNINENDATDGQEISTVSVLDANKNEACLEKDDLLYNSPMTTLGKSYSSINEEEELTTINSQTFEGKRNSLPYTNEKLSISSDFETSSSTRTSVSSLNNVSRESMDSFTKVTINPKILGKAASFDALQSGDSVVDPLSPIADKAASSETLDQSMNKRRQESIQDSRLCLRNRSNSAGGLIRFANNLDLSETEKGVSLDHRRKYRITKDPMNRRRSWALNDSHSLNSFYKSSNSSIRFPYDEQDVSVILDAPPKLPPKLKNTNKHSLISKSSDNIQAILTSIDIKPENNEKRQYFFGGKTGDISSQKESSDKKPHIYPRTILPNQQAILTQHVPEKTEVDLVNKTVDVSEDVIGITTKKSDVMSSNSKNPELKLNLQLSTFAPSIKRNDSPKVNIDELIETMENKAKDAKGKLTIQVGNIYL